MSNNRRICGQCTGRSVSNRAECAIWWPSKEHITFYCNFHADEKMRWEDDKANSEAVRISMEEVDTIEVVTS